ncbi:MAG: SpoIIIAH-like family protein [Clostridia bacterium]|nr:SpoIIIAH-like family protein [Clostridia bacterium]
MNVIIKKRQIIMSALVLALGSAVFVNWYFTRPEASQTGSEENVSYSVLGDAQYVSSSNEKTTAIAERENSFAQFNMTRQKTHDEAFDLLKKVINDPSASKSAVDNAAKQLAKLTDLIKLESDIETLVKSKCGLNCMVMINSDKIDVVCEKGKLDATSTLQIKEIILKHTQINSGNITIFETK